MMAGKPLLLLVSAPGRDALNRSLGEIRRAAGKGPEALRGAVAAAGGKARGERPGAPAWRLAVTGLDADSATDRLEAAGRALAGEEPAGGEIEPGVFLGRTDPAGPGEVAFLFPGQGSQKPGMLRRLGETHPVLAETFARADSALAGESPGTSLVETVYPADPSLDDSPEAMAELTRTEVAQPALAAAGMGLARILDGIGLECSMAAGHSAGEYTALGFAGALDELELYRLLRYRGLCMREAGETNPGTMAAVMAGADRVNEILAEIPGAWAANFNSPAQTVISGSSEAIEKALAAFRLARVKGRTIPVAGAFHTRHMAPAAEKLADRLGELAFREPEKAVYSNTLAGRYPRDPGAFPALLSRHLVEPVRFVEQVEEMYRDGARIFIEAGPGTVLSGLVARTLEGRDCTIVSPGREPGAGEDGETWLWKSLARVFCAGVIPRHWPGSD